MGWLHGEVVLVTGGGSGLGAAVVKRCLEEGAEVAVLELMEQKVEKLKAEYGNRVLTIRGDVTQSSDIQECRDAVAERYGRLSALIGTQGIWDNNIRLRDMSLSDLDRAFVEIFDINVKGYLKTARAFAELLTASRGSITFTLSNAAYLSNGGGVLYTATKHAVLGVVRQLAFEFAPEIRVNGVAPAGIGGSDLRGLRALGLHERSQADIPPDEFAAAVKRVMPLARFCSAEDYTSLYVLLASATHSGTMTGQVIVADQGLSIRGMYQASSHRNSGTTSTPEGERQCPTNN